MNRFDYVRPGTVAEAVAAGAQPGSAYLAAGTNLLDLMKIGVARPARLVDLNYLPGLDGIEALEDGALRIGAQVRNADLAHDPGFRRRFPAVAEALLSGASAQLRNWRPQSYYDQPGRGTLARDGGGVLLTQAIHTLDLLISLAGLPPEVSAYATTTPIHAMETEDLVVAAVRYQNGAIGTIQATTTAYPGFPDRIEIIGTRGTASLTGEALAAHFHDGTSVETGAETAGGAGADPMAFSHGLHRALISDFLDAVETGRPPKIGGADALMAHDLIEAILSSSAAGLPKSVRRR